MVWRSSLLSWRLIFRIRTYCISGFWYARLNGNCFLHSLTQWTWSLVPFCMMWGKLSQNTPWFHINLFQMPQHCLHWNLCPHRIKKSLWQMSTNRQQVSSNSSSINKITRSILICLLFTLTKSLTFTEQFIQYYNVITTM